MAESRGVYVAPGIQKLGPKHYEVKIEGYRDASGKRQRPQRTVHGTLADAKKVRTKLEADRDRGALVGSSNQLVADYLRSWVTSKRSTVSGRTYERYVSLIESSIIPALGAVKLQKLKPQHLRDYYAASLLEPGRRAGSTLSPTTVHHRHVVLTMALKQAADDDLIAKNPADRVKAPQPAKVKDRLRCLNGLEAQRFRAATEGKPDLLPVLLALDTGARLGEILALRWSDLDLDGGKMMIRRTLVEPLKRGGAGAWYSFKPPKNTNARRLSIGAPTVDALRQHKTAQAAERLRCGVAWADLDLVVTGLGGLPMRPSTMSTRFKRLVAEMNRCKPCEGKGTIDGNKCPKCDGSGSTHEFDGEDGPMRFHDLRHSHASVLLASGVPTITVSKKLGHYDPSFTMSRYGHELPGQDEAANEKWFEALKGA